MSGRGLGKAPRVTSIDDAMSDMLVNGEEGLGVSGVGEAVASSYPAPPPHDIPNEYQVSSPPQAVTEKPSGETYFLITYNETTEVVKVEQLTEQEAIERLEQLGGIAKAVSMLPTQNPAHWSGRFAIIRGSLVVPKEVRTIKLI